MRAFGAKAIDSYDEINIVMGSKKESVVIDFDKTIMDLGDNDTQIQLLLRLR